MKYSQSLCEPDNYDYANRTYHWCKKHNQMVNGFAYDDPLVGFGGVHIVLLVPEGSSKEDIEDSLSLIRQERDVVSQSVLYCPQKILK